MKAIILEEPGQFSLTDTFPANETSQNEALVRVHRVGICGTDLHAFEGVQPFFSYPRILGHELGVEILQVGENSDGLKVGDLCAVEPYLHCGNCVACRRGKTNCCANLKVLGVHADGGMRESLSVPTNKLHKSEKLTLDQLALVEPLSIGFHAVSRAGVEPGEFVLVVGAGPIGLSVIQFVQFLGVKIIVMDINQDRLNFAQANFRIEAAIKFGENSPDELNKLTNNELPVTVFDATGNQSSMNNAFNLVAAGGQIVFVGLFQGNVTFDDPNAHKRELTLHRSRNATGEDFRKVISLMESGEVNIDPWITHRVLFAEVTNQFESWLDPNSKFIKAVIRL
ncbi:MAG: zinc-binding alcohol dehydrogenase family protein [Actinomycetota bacterium]